MERLFKNGALAQLGERGLCKPEVKGSIPLSSTKSNSRLRAAFLFLFEIYQIPFFKKKIAMRVQIGNKNEPLRGFVSVGFEIR